MLIVEPPRDDLCYLVWTPTRAGLIITPVIKIILKRDVEKKSFKILAHFDSEVSCKFLISDIRNKAVTENKKEDENSESERHIGFCFVLLVFKSISDKRSN